MQIFSHGGLPIKCFIFQLTRKQVFLINCSLISGGSANMFLSHEMAQTEDALRGLKNGFLVFSSWGPVRVFFCFLEPVIGRFFLFEKWSSTPSPKLPSAMKSECNIYDCLQWLACWFRNLKVALANCYTHLQLRGQYMTEQLNHSLFKDVDKVIVSWVLPYWLRDCLFMDWWTASRKRTEMDSIKKFVNLGHADFVCCDITFWLLCRPSFVVPGLTRLTRIVQY